MPYRVLRTAIVRPDERYEPGDEIEPSEAELAAFGDNLEEVAADDGGDADADADGADADAESADDDEAMCGAELTAGGTCARPADDCPYHGPDADDADGE